MLAHWPPFPAAVLLLLPPLRWKKLPIVEDHRGCLKRPGEFHAAAARKTTKPVASRSKGEQRRCLRQWERTAGGGRHSRSVWQASSAGPAVALFVIAVESFYWHPRGQGSSTL